MKAVVVLLLAAVAVSQASPILPAVILPKVNIGAPEIEVVKQPITIQQPEYVYRSVPVPIKAVQYTAPAVVHHPVIAAHAFPALHVV